MTIPQSSQEPVTGRLLLRAIIKAFCLFAAFNIVYGLINPVETGQLPALYNTVLSGRTRFMKFWEFDPYRMVDSHVIRQATADTFNIVILGSSEMWGAGTLADLTIPAKLDQMGLVAPDGRPVRVYNLAHPTPYAFRDLIILDVALQRNIPIDLVLISTFDASLVLRYIWAPVARANNALSVDVLKRYDILAAYTLLSGVQVGDQTPFFLRLWRDRDALMTWVVTQAQGVPWSFTRIDFNVDQDESQPGPGLLKFEETMSLDRIDPPPSTEFLTVFKRLSDETGIPIVILAAPVPFKNNEFAPWLQAETQEIGLPLMDCWQIFRSPAYFEEFVHIQPVLHDVYAHIIAKHLSDPTFAAESWRLRLPADFVQPAESCALYAASH